MKLSEVSSYISKEIAFSAAVTSCLTPQDWQLEDDLELNGGFVKDSQYAWLTYGPNFQVIRTSNCAKVAAWTFGASVRNQKTKITCVTELPCSDGLSRVSRFIIGLALDPDKGMVCVFDVRGSKVLRAINMPAKVTSLSVVDCGYGGCCPLPQLLSSMNGILAVGLAGGQVLLIDLCHINCDEGLSLESYGIGGICDELHPANLIYVNKRERDPQTLEFKRSYAARTGEHLCSVLNDEFLSEKELMLPVHFHDVHSIQRSQVDVTALLYVPHIASIVIGFSFGCFQIWNLTRLVFVYMSPMLQEERQIAALGFQEPCDDPRNFCYLWAVYGNKECNRYNFPYAIMYALCYKTKEWIDAYGFLYQDFISCTQRFDLDLVGEEGMVGGQIIACHTVNKLISSTTRKDDLQNELDESTQEADLTLTLFAWETWGTNNNSSLKMAIFDLNQWYKEQMPGRISQGMTSGQVASYMALFSLEKIQAKPLLDVSINPEGISQFTAVQNLEEHFYPWSLAFDSCSLFSDRIILMNHPGVQRDMLSHLEHSGPSCFLHPTKLFLQCVSMGLKPVYVDVSSLSDWTLPEQREFLLSVALEYQLVGLLSRCATEWADGSQSALSCTLSTFLKWGWKRATTLKSQADALCVPLYDFSGVSLDTNSYKLLDYCGNQLHHLSSLFHGVLKMCRSSVIAGVGDISQQAEVLELVATYIEVVEWFINVGLLPESPFNDSVYLNECEDIGVEMEHLKVPYPVADLNKFYKDRREELERLHSFSAEKNDILFIDRLVKEECGEKLSSFWVRDGNAGLYPPSSIQSLLRIYLLDGIPMHIKHSIIIYVFLDLSTYFEDHKAQRYAGTVSQFVKFPSAFRLTPSVIKITQALWLLDHREFLAAIDGLLDPLVSMDDLKPWQHQCIIKAFLYQGQQQLALSYIRVQQPPLGNIDDIRLNLTVLLVNGLIHEAFQFQRQRSNDVNSSDLLNHFFNICQQINQLGLVLQLPLTPTEEDAFINFLHSCQNSLADDMRVMYYLERSRIAEAMHVNDIIRSRRYNLESNPLKRNRTDDGTNCVRDTIVKAYANTLPSVTKKLAEYCAQQKSAPSNWKQITRPTPMSVAVHRGELQPVQYRSSLLQATLEKARETWNQIVQPPAPPCTPANQNGRDVLETIPFLCTPRAASDTVIFSRDNATVIFPKLKKSVNMTEDDDFMESSPAKRFRYVDFSSVESPVLSAVRKPEADIDALALLQTPHVRRRTASSIAKEQEMQNCDVFTPQSILKVSKLVQSVTSEDVYEESAASASGSTPEILDDILSKQEKISTPVLSARQIRFSFPVEEPSSRSISSEGTAEELDRASTARWVESRYLTGAKSVVQTAGGIHGGLAYKTKDKQSSERNSTTFVVEEVMEPGIGDMIEEEMNFTLTLSQYYRKKQALSKEATVTCSKHSIEIQSSDEEEQHNASDSSVCLEEEEETFHSIDSSYHTSGSPERLAIQKVEKRNELPLIQIHSKTDSTAQKIKDESSSNISTSREGSPESKMQQASSEILFEESHFLPSPSDDEHLSSFDEENQTTNISALESGSDVNEVKVVEEKLFEESHVLPSVSDDEHLSNLDEKNRTLNISALESESDASEVKEEVEENSKQLDESIYIIEERSYEVSHILPSSSDELHSSFFDVSNTLDISYLKSGHGIYGEREDEDNEIRQQYVIDTDGVTCLEEEQSKQYEELRPVRYLPDPEVLLEERLEEKKQNNVTHVVDMDDKSCADCETWRMAVSEANKELQEEIHPTNDENECIKNEGRYKNIVTEEETLESSDEKLNENIIKEEIQMQTDLISEELKSRDDGNDHEYIGSNNKEVQEIQKQSGKVNISKDQKLYSDITAPLKAIDSGGGIVLDKMAIEVQEKSLGTDIKTVIESGLEETDGKLLESHKPINSIPLKPTLVEGEAKEKHVFEGRSSEMDLGEAMLVHKVSEITENYIMMESFASKVGTDTASLQQSAIEPVIVSSVTANLGKQVIKRNAKRASSLQPEDSYSSRGSGRKQKSRANSAEPNVCSVAHIKIGIQNDNEKDVSQSDNRIRTEQEMRIVGSQEKKKYSKKRASSLQPGSLGQEDQADFFTRKSSRRSRSLAPESVHMSHISHIDSQEISRRSVSKSRKNNERYSKADSECDAENVAVHHFEKSCQKVGSSTDALCEGTDSASYDLAPKRKRRSCSLQPESVYTIQVASLERKSRRSSSLQPESLGYNETKDSHLYEKENTESNRSNVTQNENIDDSRSAKRDYSISKPGTSGSLKSKEMDAIKSTFETQRWTRSRRSASLQPEISLLMKTETESKEKKIPRRRSRSLQPELPSELQDMNKDVLQSSGDINTQQITSADSAVNKLEEETRVHAVDAVETTFSDDRNSTVSSEASTIKLDLDSYHLRSKKRYSSSVCSTVSTIQDEDLKNLETGAQTDKAKSVCSEMSKVVGGTESLKDGEMTKPIKPHYRRSSGKARSVCSENISPIENKNIRRSRRSCSVPLDLIGDVRTVSSPKNISALKSASNENDLQQQESKTTEASRILIRSSQREMEEYTTARRLTRHQRLLLERSLELTKGSHSLRERKLSKLPVVPESSDREEADSESLSQASSTATRSSTRLQSHRNMSPSSSQASVKQGKQFENIPRRSSRHRKSSASGSMDFIQEDNVEDSPHSIKSEDSTFYTSSFTRASPSSTQSGEIASSTLKRRSLRNKMCASSGSDIIETKLQESSIQSVSDSSDAEGSVASSAVSSRSSLRGQRTQKEGELRRSTRMNQLQREVNVDSGPFEFSPPTFVSAKSKKEVLSIAPNFIFSPPEKTQETIKTEGTSHPVRAHKMALRGLHTIAEESTSSTPSTSSTLSEGTPKRVLAKRSKRLKTGKIAESGQEKQSLSEKELGSGRTVSKKPKYGLFKQRKIFYLRKNKSKSKKNVKPE